MKEIYNIISEIDNDIRIVSTIEVEGENHNECVREASKRLYEFKESLRFEIT